MDDYSNANTPHVCGRDINEVISLNKCSTDPFKWFTDYVNMLTNGS